MLAKMFSTQRQALLYGIGCIFFLSLILPILIIFFNGISLSSAIEETIGARYFYGLRYLYGNETPWIPQGHFVGLSHYVIQLILTASGHPPTELSPRIDLFTLAAIILPHFTSAVCFVWAVRPLQTTSARLLVAALALAIGYSSTLAVGIELNQHVVQMIWWVILPDYLAWALPFAFVTMGAILRIISKRRWQVLTLKGSIWLGVFVGTALTTKITFLVFPFAVVSVLLFFAPKWKTLYFLLTVTFPSAAFVILIILLAFYKGNVGIIIPHFNELLSFIQAESDRTAWDPNLLYSLDYWTLVLTPKNTSDILYLPLITIAAILLVGLIKRSDRFLLALVPACVLSIIVALNRFYFVSWTEVLFFCIPVLVTWGARVFQFPRHTISSVAFAPLPVLLSVVRTALSIILIWLVFPGTLAKFEVVYQFSKAIDIGSQELNSRLKHMGGKTAFLIPINNNYHPRTINSAICKGGTQWSNPQWGDSKYMKDLFPDEACFVMPEAPGNVDMTPFDNAVIVHRTLGKETREETLKWTEDYFHMSLKPFGCTQKITFPDSDAIICTRLK